MKHQGTDAHLLESFAEGNREAIASVCRNSAKRLMEHGSLTDEGIVDLLRQILERIGNGQSPDEAFGWSQQRKGRMSENNALRDWDIRTTVRDLMRDGKTLHQATKEVCSENNGEFLRGFKTIEKICDGLSPKDEIPLPEDIFPMPKISGEFPWRRKSNLDLDRTTT